jgi:hypothetical protein
VHDRLDDEKLETLRSWGSGLGVDERDELRAAGKAILILVEEIEQLQVDVWHARQADPVQLETDPGEAPEPLDSALRSRLRRLVPSRSPKTR